MLLTIGTSSTHGDRVSRVHQESEGMNFSQKVKKFTQEKNLLREDPLSPFRGLNEWEKLPKEFFQTSKLRVNIRQK